MNQTNTKKDNISNQFFLSIIIMVGCAHLLNDLIQSMLTSLYPLLEEKYTLTFAQIGCISLVYQITASILQPAIGFYTDKYPKPYLLPIGMTSTAFGLVMLGFANNFYLILIAAAFLGIGSSVFHPEASRVARNASAGKYGFAQSAFQVGGNLGSSIGPLLVSFIVLRYNTQSNILWFSVFAFMAIILLFQISKWSAKHLITTKRKPAISQILPFNKTKTIFALIVLGLLIFSKYFYMASMTNYYTFYLIEKYSLAKESAVIYLFLFLAAVAVGTFAGGPIGDRIGRKYVIWFSILGAAPFTLALPYVSNLFWTATLSIFIGLILSSAFSAIVVYAQELIPGRVGMIAGLFFGLMFGMSGIAAAVLGYVADSTSLQYIFQLCSFLPLLGILTIFLPNIEHATIS